jgi:hypothetical protein
LSEHNYEEQVDEDAALKIINFGDDYRNFIDSLSDGLSSANENKRTSKSRKKCRKSKVGRQAGVHVVWLVKCGVGQTRQTLAKPGNYTSFCYKAVN